jgi:hypothetical protein
VVDRRGDLEPVQSGTMGVKRYSSTTRTVKEGRGLRSLQEEEKVSFEVESSQAEPRASLVSRV